MATNNANIYTFAIGEQTAVMISLAHG